MVLRLREHEARTYLEERGYKVSHDFYYKLRKEVQESMHTRLSLIASEEFAAAHVQRLDTLRTIENELWSCYYSEVNPTKRVSILMQLADIQQYLAAFMDSTQYIMQSAARIRKQQQEVNHS
jgi:hypothetical protein